MADMAQDYHFSLSLSKSLFTELLGAALPVSLSKGPFDLAKNLRQGLDQLQVRRRVAGLLEDRGAPQPLRSAYDRVNALWESRREEVYRWLAEMLAVEGEWQAELDGDGSGFVYGHQLIGANAVFRFSATGRVILLKENIEVPFELSKRVAAHVNLGNVRYDRTRKELLATIQDVGIRLGDHPVFEVVDGYLAQVLQSQLVDKYNPLTILKKEMIDGILPSGGPLKIKMDVDDLAVEIGESHITLKVRFGFSQLQLTAADVA